MDKGCVPWTFEISANTRKAGEDVNPADVVLTKRGLRATDLSLAVSGHFANRMFPPFTHWYGPRGMRCVMSPNPQPASIYDANHHRCYPLRHVVCGG